MEMMVPPMVDAIEINLSRLLDGQADAVGKEMNGDDAQHITDGATAVRLSKSYGATSLMSQSTAWP